MARPRSSTVDDPPETPNEADAGGVAVAESAPPNESSLVGVSDEPDGQTVATAEAPPEACAEPGCQECAPAVAEAPLEQAAAEAAATVLSDEDRQFLARRNAVESAVDAVEAAAKELAEVELELEELKKTAKGREAAYEAAQRRLLLSLHDNPADAPLFNQGSEPAATPVSASAPVPVPDAADPEAVKAWEAEWNNWLDTTPVSALGLSDSISEALAAHSSPVRTMRELTALTSDQYHPEGYQQVKGIGLGKSDQIQEAYDKLMTAFLEQHPRPKSGQTPPTPDTSPVDPPPADYDFETTFPTPVDATSNETYDTDYHQAIICDAVDELTELQALKADLAAGKHKGKEITTSKRKSLETALGDVQFQFDEGLSGYGSTFGAKAAERLKAHVEAKVEKKASLKGGLE